MNQSIRSPWVTLGLVCGLLCMLLMPDRARAGQFYEKAGVAINGYDPVAYFEDRKAVKGTASLAYRYRGSFFRFASQVHLDAFIQTPERFAPQFGGFCAYGVAEGAKAKSEGDVWEIVNGKLYLNYDSDIQAKWKLGRDALIREAEAKWPVVESMTAMYE